MLIDAYKNNSISFSQCTGCAACANSCKKDAICMEMDCEGFYFPKVDLASCVSCGSCIKVCPVLNRPDTSAFKKKLFSGYDKSLVYMKKCSSGGVFGLLTEEIITQGGVVYGAAFNASGYDVHHVSSDKVSLEEIYRSKYVQSNIGAAYKAVKKDLVAGRRVLFCGCPCQTEGLHNFLNRSYENLITVDFLCHGVPSPGIFKKVLEDAEGQRGKIRNVTFREKDSDVATQKIHIYFENSQKLTFISLDHYYFYLFLYNCILRKSCMTCDRSAHRVTDLTLADDWTQNWQKDPHVGVSLIQVNTEKGMAAFDGVRNRLVDKELALTDRDYLIAPHAYSVRERDKTFAIFQKSNGLYRLKRRFYFLKRRNEMKTKTIAVLRKSYYAVRKALRI